MSRLESNKSDVSSANSSEMGKRLKREVQKIGGPSYIADELGVSRSTLYSWFNTGLIHAPKLAVLAQLGADLGHILEGGHGSTDKRRTSVGDSGGIVGSSGGAVSGFARMMRPPPEIIGGSEDLPGGVAIDDYVWVPLFDVQAAGGNSRLTDEETIKAYNPYRRDYLAKRGLIGANLIEVTVVGDSMADELRDGDTVLVDTGDTRIQGGAIYVVRIGSDLLVKYLQQLPGGAIQVSSENDAYPTYQVPPDALDEDLVIVGRVRHQGRDR